MVVKIKCVPNYHLLFLFLAPNIQPPHYYVNQSKNRYSVTRRLILSVNHHFDGYPEGLGVKLKEHYNTYEKVAELIDGGNMSNCWSDSKFNVETGEFTPIADPKPTYYGGDDEAPVLSKNFDDFTRIDSWQEYSYVFVKDRWEGYAISHKMDENYEEIVSVNVRNVQIPEPETV